MAATYGLTNACKLDLVNGVHQPGDVYMVALYDASATLNAHTEVYTKEGEVKGQGYVAGGTAAPGYKSSLQGARAEVNLGASLSWKNATIRARHALVYNKSKGNRAITVLDLGQETASTNGNWDMDLPAAVIWIG
jgi:hypothetical protein